MVRSPVDICLGTRPIQAEKSRPLANAAPLPIAATIALEMIGPIPGTVITLFETWVMLNERFLQSNPPDVVARLEPKQQESLRWLTDYFGKDKPYKDSALKIIRDKTAFHYDRLNLSEAADNLAAGENSLYLAQHPANSLYYLGSALVFRAIFAMIADKAGGAAYGGHNDRTITGLRIAQEDAKNANWHMHMMLYGLILLLMDDVLGQPAGNEQQVRINVLDAPAPERVGIPAFIDIGA